MASNQKLVPQMVGMPILDIGTAYTSLGLNAAATWMAFSFIPDAAKTLNSVKIFIVSVTGSVGVNDITLTIVSDGGGKPSASVVGGPFNTVSPAVAASTWVSFTPSTALSAGTQYWLVFKNVNGTPASNFVNIGFYPASNMALQSFGNSLWGWQKASTTNSGTAWTLVADAGASFRLGYSDGSYQGLPVQGNTGTGSAIGVYLTRELGCVFVTPANAIWNVRGVSFEIHNVGAPPGNLRYRLYNGTTLLATTSVITNPLAGGWSPALFSATQKISPGTTLRVSMGVDAGGDTSNYYRFLGYSIDNDANSKMLMPFGTVANPTNAMKQTYFNGTSWADTDTTVFAMMLLLDSEGEYAPPWPRVFGMGGGFGG